MMDGMGPEDKLTEVREQLHQEWVSLQVVGRALTVEEEMRSQALAQAVSLIDEALAILQEEEEEEELEEDSGDEDFEGW